MTGRRNDLGRVLGPAIVVLAVLFVLLLAALFWVEAHP